MRKHGKINPGFLCPICIVRFPYSEKLANHWKFFHGSQKQRMKSYPSIQSVAASHRNSRIHIVREERIGVVEMKLPELKIFHTFKVCTVNVHIPQICKFCEDIIWNCAKYCTDCGYICHVDCQHLVTKHCQKVITYQEMKTKGEVSQMSPIGDIRPRETSTPLASPIPSPTREPKDHNEMDFTYITDRVIALSFPAHGLESVYRASLLGVLQSVQKKHSDRYKIFNLSERRYDLMQLNNQGCVLDFGWPDHLAPTLNKLHQIINAIHSWLHQDSKNVAILHCKGGISRISVVIASYVQYSKNIQSPQGAMNWFALRRYFDTKLEGSLLPSQKRYVEYYGNIFEKKFKISNRVLTIQNIIIHGVPSYGNGSGFNFFLKIYHGYILKHTTKIYCVPSKTERYCVSFEDQIPITGDVMVKCFKKDILSQNPIFRLQFNTFAVSDCVAVFGKYDLDEAEQESLFPDSTYIEFIFTPMDPLEYVTDKKLFNSSEVDDISPTTYTKSKSTASLQSAYTQQLDYLIDEMLANKPIPVPDKNGIFNLDRSMTTTHASHTENLVHPYHVPGPLNGNPYAQIDSNLKERLKSRPSIQNSQNLSQGIEDLDDLLGDLGFVTSQPDINANTHIRINSRPQASNHSQYSPDHTKYDSHTHYAVPQHNNYTIHERLRNRPSVGEVKYAPVNSQRKASVEQAGRLHQAPAIHYRPKNNSNANDDVFRETILTTNVNELLQELDESPLNYRNNSIIGKPRSSKTNMSSYDNDGSISGSSEIDAFEDKNDTSDGVMVIQAGTVAQHVESLSKVLFKDENSYNRKMGVPLAGLASPKLVEEKVTEFNSRSLAKGFCSQPMESVYHSHGGPTRINYDVSVGTDQVDGNRQYFDLALSANIKSLEESLEENQQLLEEHKRRGELLRSDSAYGESMSSSSSVVSPPYIGSSLHDDRHMTTDATKQLHINATEHYSHHDDEDYSPRSDNNQAKSSGIGSRSSSIASLEYEDEAPGYIKVGEFRPTEVSEPLVTETLKKDEPIDFSKNRSLSIVDEKVQSVTIQREVEFMNDDIFKNLLDDDQKSVDSVRVISRIPIEVQCNSVNVVNRENDTQHNEKEDISPKYNFETLQQQHIKDTSQKRILPNGVAGNNTGHFVVEETAPIKYSHELHNEPLEEKSNEILQSHTLSNYNHDGKNGSNEQAPIIEYRQGIKFENGIVPATEESLLLANGNFYPSSTLPNGSIHKQLFQNKSTSQNNVVVTNSNDVSYSTNAFQFPIEADSDRRRNSHDNSSVNSDEQGSPRSPKSPKNGHLTLRTRRMRSSGSSNSSISSSELFHEVARYPSIKFDKDTMNLWYKPSISREEATQLLKDKDPGSFVVRDSQSYDGAFGLAVKVETPPIGVLQQVGGDISKIDLENELVRHFLIEPSKKGVRLKGSNNEPAFPSLVALIYQHTLTKMALPVPLVIPEPENNELRKSNLTESQLLQKGAACNLVYLGSLDVESLTGDGAIHYAMNKVTSGTNLQQKTTIVNIKVNQQGITLTDNQRKLFFRKHYIMRDIIHCGVDPKGRKINLKPLVENVDKEVGCFGFVVRKQTNSLENECHLMAELDVDQPASAVINFIHKAMRYALHV